MAEREKFNHVKIITQFVELWTICDYKQRCVVCRGRHCYINYVKIFPSSVTTEERMNMKNGPFFILCIKHAKEFGYLTKNDDKILSYYNLEG